MSTSERDLFVPLEIQPPTYFRGGAIGLPIKDDILPSSEGLPHVESAVSLIRGDHKGPICELFDKEKDE